MTSERLAALARLLEAIGRPAAILGGLAVAVHGRPRMTLDADVTVDLEPDQARCVLDAALQVGFEPRVADPEGFARDTRVLPLRQASDLWEVDLIFAGSPYEREALARARVHRLGGVELPVMSAEDLLIHKILAGRPRDIEDVRAIVERQSTDLDRGTVRAVLLELAEALADDELRRRVEELLR